VSRVVVNEFVTLDGVMQSPGYDGEDTRGGFKDGGWQPPFFDDVLGAAVGGGIQAADGFLLGRRTYEIFAGHWPNQPDDDPMAPIFNEKPKYVASRTLKAPLEWANSTLLEGDAADAVRKLKEQPGGDILVIGSGELVQTLMQNNLVDAYHLVLHPLVLGGGRRLFPDGSMKTQMRLADVTRTTRDVLILTYEPAGTDTNREGDQ
jgi:dihydrofolate reductase